jgi:hypothetical protein
VDNKRSNSLCLLYYSFSECFRRNANKDQTDPLPQISDLQACSSPNLLSLSESKISLLAFSARHDE